MNQRIDETFLQRWLNKELTDKELEEFKKSSDYLLYEKIMTVSSGFEEPVFDSEKVFGKIRERIEEKRTEPSTTKVIKLNWKLIAAASVALFLGLFYYINLPVTHKSGFGEHLAVMLPDSSEVLLNSKSNIKYNKRAWKNSRALELDGEAFFKVKKGKSFTVNTGAGAVTVLGTQFDVYATNDYLEVKCFEGKVRVISNKNENILTKGMALRSFKNGNTENWTILEQEPKWKNGESSFRSIALKYIVLSIENQYDIKIKTDNVDLSQKFTGSYTHTNLKVALKTVFEPMKIDAIFTDEKTVTLVKQ